MKSAPYFSLLLLLPLAPARADTPIQLQHAATPQASITIRNVKGSVNVVGWDRNQVDVGGSLGDGAKPLEITGSDDHLTVEVTAQGRSGGWFNWGGNNAMGPTRLELHVPRAAALKVEVVSAPLTIDGTVGGSIDVSSVSGKVRINARTPLLKVDSVSGSIEQAGRAEQADLQTVSGDILAPALGRQAKLETVSGRIQVNGGPWNQFKLSTVSGDVQVAGALAAHGQVNIDSMSGDVQLQLPTDVSARLHASSFSGDLRSEFGTPQKGEDGPGSELNATAGSGDGTINVETFSGDLRIRRAN